MTSAPALDLEKLQAARVWVTREQPYLAIALHSLQLRAAPGLGRQAEARDRLRGVQPPTGLPEYNRPEESGTRRPHSTRAPAAAGLRSARCGSPGCGTAVLFAPGNPPAQERLNVRSGSILLKKAVETAGRR